LCSSKEVLTSIQNYRESEEQLHGILVSLKILRDTERREGTARQDRLVLQSIRLLSLLDSILKTFFLAEILHVG